MGMKTLTGSALSIVALGLALAGCAEEIEGPAPTVAALAPALVCNEQLTTEVVVNGSGLSPLPIDVLNSPEVALPQLSLTRTSDLFGGGGAGATQELPDDTEPPHVRWTSQERMAFDVYPELELEVGVHSLTVENRNGETFVLDSALTVVPPPVVSEVGPDLVCVAQGAQTLTLTGEGFLQVGEALPTVFATPADGGDPVVFTPDGLDGCSDVAGPTQGVRSCETLTFTVEQEGLAVEGDFSGYEITVENPAPAGCVSSEPVVLTIVPPPEVTTVDPPVICIEEEDATITLTGDGFLDIDGALPTVTIGTETFTPSALDDCLPVDGPAEDVESCETLTFTIPVGGLDPGSYEIGVVNPPPADCAAAAIAIDIAPPPDITGVVPARICQIESTLSILGSNFIATTQVAVGATAASSVDFVSESELAATFPPMDPGTYDVTVSNGGGCDDVLPGGVTVIEDPVLFFVDPPVVYNGISLQVTLYASGVEGTVTSVTMTPSGGGTTETLDHTFNPDRPNRILATVPEGTAPGTYDISIGTDMGCEATLEAGLVVTDTLTVALEAIDPPFGWTDGRTDVLITATDPPPAGEVGFAATPRAYLNPASGDGLATPLRSVVFVNEAQLNAVVPAGMAEGVYDLVVVNPDGTVGVVFDAFSVGAEPPPVIDEVTPASVINSGDQPITAFGSSFRSPSAELFCESPVAGAVTLTGTVTASTSDSVDITVPADALERGTVCIVRITNDDGTYADYSAISVTNPSANLYGFTASTDMIVARRAPAAVAGRATRVSRFVYAIGGDDGTAAGAFDSVEAAPVDLFGAMEEWRTLSTGLPAPRTLAGVAILGRYVYLVGGNDGSGPVSTVHRALILDPEESPELVDLEMHRSDGTALEGGTWHYRVSAVFPDDDPDNPGGESLTSDPWVVLVPDLDETVELTLHWTGVPGASAYRVYRSPAVDDPAGSELLLAEVPADGPLSYRDVGDAVGTQAPLRVGDTGRWAPQPSLSQPREASGVAIAEDFDVAGTFYLYAVGGRSDTAALATYERATITVDADGRQTLGDWTEDATNVLDTARSQLRAFAVDHAEASRVDPGMTYLYAPAGLGDGGGTVSDTDVALVGDGGVLEAWSALDSLTPACAGYGAAAANNQLFVFGGQGASPSTSSLSAEICDPSIGGCGGGAPELVNWNSLGGGGILTERYLMGSAVESAFIFIIGGETTGGAPTATTEITVW